MNTCLLGRSSPSCPFSDLHDLMEVAPHPRLSTHDLVHDWMDIAMGNQKFSSFLLSPCRRG